MDEIRTMLREIIRDELTAMNAMKGAKNKLEFHKVGEVKTGKTTKIVVETAEASAGLVLSLTKFRGEAVTGRFVTVLSQDLASMLEKAVKLANGKPNGKKGKGG